MWWGLVPEIAPGKEHLGNLFIDLSFEPELPFLVRLAEVAAASHVARFHQVVRARSQLLLVGIFLNWGKPGYQVGLMIHQRLLHARGYLSVMMERGVFTRD
jgi:hypothetical protein